MPVFIFMLSESDPLFVSALSAASGVWFFYGALISIGFVILIHAGFRHFSLGAASTGSADSRAGGPLLDRQIPPRMAVFVLLALLGCQALCLSLRAITKLTKLLPPDRLELFWLIVSVLVFHLSIIFATIFAARRFGLDPERSFGLSSRSLLRGTRQGILYYLGALPIFAGIALGYRYLLEALSFTMVPQEMVKMLLSDLPAGLLATQLLIALILAPIAEELLFRGLALPLLAQVAGIRSATVAVSFMFAFAHLHVPSFLPLLALGVVLACAYYRTTNLAAPIVIHMLFNAVNIVLIVAPQS